MKSAVDIARYFLCRVDREAGDTISPLKLQKLVYYAQAWSLVFRNKPLFFQDIEAWVYGPAISDVWDEYKPYHYRDIPPPEELIEFAKDEIEVLEEVWDTYGELSARYLQELTHSETPWRNARKDLEPAQQSNNIISHSDMKAFYSKMVEVEA
ncbi:Panacea domain-containing protein [Dapis sp. BLCC M126]|uniref:Panacea domain-containing protein n=1 Tax=Dapis sp. BLCC M126 TaxID=3400189 RepID=UPI003CED1970